MEEVGLELEDDMQLIGGYQETKTRDQCISNVFMTFAAVAKSMDFKVDSSGAVVSPFLDTYIGR